MADNLMKETAYHEAGHTAMAFIARKKFSYVTVQPSEGHGGHVLFSRDKTGKRRRLYVVTSGGAYRERTKEELMDVGEHLEKRILIYVAGNVACGIFYQSHHPARVWHGARKDYDSAWQIASQLLESRMTRKLSTGYDSPAEIIVALETRAYGLLTIPQVWAGVEALAAALLSRQTLKYKEARGIFADAYWATEREAKSNAAKGR